jgi:hypothetical protein
MYGNWGDTLAFSHFPCLQDDVQVLFKFGGDHQSIIIPGLLRTLPLMHAMDASARGSLIGPAAIVDY